MLSSLRLNLRSDVASSPKASEPSWQPEKLHTRVAHYCKPKFLPMQAID